MAAMCRMLFLLCLLHVQPLWASRDVTLEPGHLKPFGEGRPSQPVEEITGAPNPSEFFETYVQPLRPIKMAGAAKENPAFTKWTDDYFLSLDEPPEHTVSVETAKKEIRNRKAEDMSFKAFVGLYNETENYMVNSVPTFIRQDFTIPCPLQCKQLVENNLVENSMWFSSGGTKSVVHFDAVDNINCVLRGNKTMVMVDPALYKDNVDLDHTSYSGVDVDRVDYTKYPGLAEVEFYHVHLVPGDCLYIPYKWVHQVRSFGSNLAVNVWWRRDLTDEIDFNDCNEKCDPGLTLKDAHFDGFGGNVLFDPDDMREEIYPLLSPDHKLDMSRFTLLITGYPLNTIEVIGDPLQTLVNKAFSLLDKDDDGIVTEEDLGKMSNNEFKSVGELLYDLSTVLDNLYAPEEQEIDSDVREDLENDKHDEL